jgi:uncharacterized membrane protein
MPEISVFCPACGRPAKARREAFSAVGRQDAVLGAIAYLTIIPAIVFLTTPPLKSSRFVRFHSWQSVFLVIATAILCLTLKLLFVVTSILPAGFLIASLALGLVFLAIVILWVVLVAKTIQGQTYELPVIGPVAARLAE